MYYYVELKYANKNKERKWPPQIRLNNSRNNSKNTSSSEKPNGEGKKGKIIQIVMKILSNLLVQAQA